MRLDVAILGGGPAGLVAACLLARGGARVGLWHGRAAAGQRPGETLPGAGLRLLRSLALPAPAGAPHRCLTGIDTAWDGILSSTDHLRSPDGAAWLIDRPAFDASLAEAAAEAGALLVEGRGRAERERAAWRLTGDGGQAAAAFLVDASGRSAAAARRAGARRVVEHDLVALWAVAEGDAPPRLERPLVERVADGWWYAVRLSPSRTYAALHVRAAVAAAARQPEQWTRLVRATRFLAPLLAAAGDFGPPRGSAADGSRLDTCHGPGWAACGDAAMAFDPLSSQGLLSAMAGGHMLAEALLEGGAAALARYADRLAGIWQIYRRRRADFYAREAA